MTVEHAVRFLIERFGPDVTAIETIGRGEWSQAFAFRRDGVDYVVRFGAYAQDFAKDRLAARWSSAALPVPEIIETGEALSRHYAVARRASGDYIDEVDGAQMRALLPALFAMLDAARSVDCSSTTGYGMWGPDGNAPYQSWPDALLAVNVEQPRTAGWRERLSTSPIGSAAFDEAYARLTELVRFCPPERCLVHSDLLHFNVLVVGDRITAVLDWGNSLYGDFLYDVAWFAFWSPWYPAWSGIDFAAEAQRHFAAIGLDVPHFDERLRCCQLHIGLDGMAYNAFTQRWSDLAATARRTLEIAWR